MKGRPESWLGRGVRLLESDVVARDRWMSDVGWWPVLIPRQASVGRRRGRGRRRARARSSWESYRKGTAAVLCVFEYIWSEEEEDASKVGGVWEASLVKVKREGREGSLFLDGPR